MAKLAGGIDTTVRFIEAVIQSQPTLKFQSVAGKELSVRDLAGLARSIQAATSVPQGRAIEQVDLLDLEKRFGAIEADTKALITRLPPQLDQRNPFPHGQWQGPQFEA